MNFKHFEDQKKTKFLPKQINFLDNIEYCLGLPKVHVTLLFCLL